jgi:hypothetical protein
MKLEEKKVAKINVKNAKENSKKFISDKKLVTTLNRCIKEIETSVGLKSFMEALFSAYLWNIKEKLGNRSFGGIDFRLRSRTYTEDSNEFHDRELEDIDLDRHFRYDMYITDLRIGSYNTSRRQAYHGNVMRQHNCCGLAVITNLGKGGIIPDRLRIGEFNLLTAETIAYVSGYRAAVGTGKVNYGMHPNLLSWLRGMGYNVDRTWENQRTDNNLYLVSKDLESHHIAARWARLLRGEKQT